MSGDAEAVLSVAAKGAPEAIAGLCRLDDAAASPGSRSRSTGSAGMRVLALPKQLAGLPAGNTAGFSFALLGLVGARRSAARLVPAAIRECRAAGIRVVMITGDYPSRPAPSRAGRLRGRGCLTGAGHRAHERCELAAAVARVTIFARIVPEQKLRIVQALKAQRRVVAMTGDGVNDAPSLKAADIGIAMGGRGTDVAREASSLVLLDDDFGSIVRTIRLGRRIYDNLRKAMAYIIAVHVPIAGLALLPLLTGLPLIFGPVHIAFLEMVIDPVCSMVFEAEAAEDDIMNAPAARRDQSSVLAGACRLEPPAGTIAFVPLAALYVLAIERGLPETDARSLTFVALVLVDLALVLVNRSFATSLAKMIGKANRALVWVSAVTVALLALVLIAPVGRALFRLGHCMPTI